MTAYEGKGNSPFGLVDMAGNVWEWTLSEADSDGAESARRLCGGSWNDADPANFRVTARAWDYPRYRYAYFGFRLARPSSTVTPASESNSR